MECGDYSRLGGLGSLGVSVLEGLGGLQAAGFRLSGLNPAKFDPKARAPSPKKRHPKA